MTTAKRLGGFGVLGIAAVVGCSLLFGANQLDNMTLWLTQSLMALSLVVVWGRTGIFSLGQSALFGIGAYAFGMTAINMGQQAYLAPSLLVAVVVSAVAAFGVGLLIFYGKVSELNVAIITLALTLATYAILNNLADPKYGIGKAKFGGYNGLVGIPMLRLGGAGSPLLTPQQTFLLIGIIVVIATAAVGWILASPLGRRLVAVRSNDLRAELLGIDVRRTRLTGFVFGGIIAGFAGGLFAATSGYASPGLFTLQPAVLVVIWVLAGGRSFLLAGLVGTFAVQGLSSWLGGSQGQFSPIFLGLALILLVLVAPQGMLGGIQRIVARARKKPLAADDGVARHEPEPVSFPAPASDRDLEPTTGQVSGTQVRALTKKFGGFTAVNDVNLDLPELGVRCIIGPNGAGKSTIFALLSGTLRPTDGTIVYAGQRLDRLLPHERARLGVGIKLQTASVFDDLSVRENLWLAAHSAAHSKTTADDEVRMLLREFELSEFAEQAAGELPHGRQQWLEIAMVAARRPKLLLLDEPTAGMTRDEATRTAELVRRLSSDAAIVVIEHDMHFVEQLNADITVLHLGKVLAEGTLSELEKRDDVRTVYLGGGHAHA